MAFAPRGSRPKADESKEKPLPKSQEDMRQPALIGMTFASNEPIRTRERVTRKPPIPRGIISAVPPRRPKEGLASASSARENEKVAPKNRKPPPSRTNPPVSRTTSRPDASSRTTKPTTTKSTSKPGIPPRPKPTNAQVAPDALTITAQLAPWIFMRSSLEEPLQKLELETEGILKEQKNELLEMERHVVENRKRRELVEQNEMFEDLCNEQNNSFTSSLLELTKELSLFLSPDPNMSSTSHLTAKFEALQEKVHSLEMDLDMYASMSKELDEAIQRGQSIKSDLDTLVTSQEESGTIDLKHPSRWKTLLERYGTLLDSRLQNLEELAVAIPLIEAYQRRKMELEVLRMALA